MPCRIYILVDDLYVFVLEQEEFGSCSAWLDVGFFFWGGGGFSFQRLVSCLVSATLLGVEDQITQLTHGMTHATRTGQFSSPSCFGPTYLSKVDVQGGTCNTGLKFVPRPGLAENGQTEVG